MKKTLVLTVIALAIIALSASAAFAGGWWLINDTVTEWNANSVSNGTNQSFTTDTLVGNPASNLASYNTIWDGQTDNQGAEDGGSRKFAGTLVPLNAPHGGYNATTNLCKTCHAVHAAGFNSFRLLKGGDDALTTRSSGESSDASGTTGAGTKRGNECMYCHSAKGGMTAARPYALGLWTEVRGEHTIGSSVLPDSTTSADVVTRTEALAPGKLANRDDASSADGTLQCYMCHSVHGALTIGNGWQGGSGIWRPGSTAGGTDTVDISNANFITDSTWDGNWDWQRKILRLDPRGDGTILADGAIGAPSNKVMNVGGLTNDSTDNRRNAIKTAFCGDCHDYNSNWLDGVNSTETSQPNHASHAQGPGVSLKIEVYGTQTSVSRHDEEKEGCRGCHAGTDSGNAAAEVATPFGGEDVPSGVGGNWPHQTIGVKLLEDEFLLGGDISGVTNDGNRVINSMDEICIDCHQWDAAHPSQGGTTGGVGVTF